MLLKQRKAFTLIELIVVISILAILGTISFISLQGYNVDARDSKRLTDIGNIEKVLDIYSVKYGKYPDPSGPVEIKYNSVGIWDQGVFDDSVLRTTKNLSKVSIDPLTDSKYTYSVLNTKKEYELGTILEGEILANISLNKANANGKIAKAYIRGNYNGAIAKASSGTTTYIFAAPSIINSDPTLTDIEEIVGQNKFVVNGKANLPSSYSGSKFEIQGATSQMIVNPLNFLVFEGNLEDIDTPEEKQTFMSNLQSAYNGSTIENTILIGNILAIDASSPSNEVSSFVGNTINNSVGRKIITLVKTTPTVHSDICYDMTETNVTNLNNYFGGDSIGPHTKDEWCTKTSIILSKGLGDIPDEVGFLSNLEILHLQFGNLTILPKTIGNLTKLTELFLDGNIFLGDLDKQFDKDSSEELGSFLDYSISIKGNGTTIDITIDE